MAALAAREAALKGVGQVQALDEIGKDIENVHAAWCWAAEMGRADLLALASHAFGLFCEWQGRHAEGLASFALAHDQLARKPESLPVRALILTWRCVRAPDQRCSGRAAEHRRRLGVAEPSDI